MGLFKKKRDPISERARALNDQIAALEAQIQKLATEKSQALSGPFPSNHTAAPELTAGHGLSPQPRLRSTTLPHGPTIKAQAPVSAAPDPIFEELDQSRIQNQPPAAAAPTEQSDELGVRKSDLASFWQRLKNNFRGPATSNPKLVNYLAAGSIQGLRPLRYEKRVARNRFFVLVIILAAVLWGIIFIFVIRKT
jgi:hypothetical protein